MSIEKAYNIWASQYDSNLNLTRDLDKKCTIKTLKNLDFKNVLELGCGTGKNTEWLLNKAERIIGLDFSQEMLHKAKAKIFDKRVLFKKVDLTKDWEIENNFVDLITASLTLEHIENLDHIFSQANLKLKKMDCFLLVNYIPLNNILEVKLNMKQKMELKN